MPFNHSSNVGFGARLVGYLGLGLLVPVVGCWWQMYGGPGVGQGGLVARVTLNRRVMACARALASAHGGRASNYHRRK